MPPGYRVPSRLQQAAWCSLLACKYREREREGEREREERLGKENCSTTLVVVTSLRLTIFFHFPTPCYAFLSPSSRHLQFAPRVFPLPGFFPFLFYFSPLRESLPKCRKDAAILKRPRFACGSPFPPSRSLKGRGKFKGRSFVISFSSRG